MEPREFFETLESRVDASKTAGMNNSYVFDIRARKEGWAHQRRFGLWMRI